MLVFHCRAQCAFHRKWNILWSFIYLVSGLKVFNSPQVIRCKPWRDYKITYSMPYFAATVKHTVVYCYKYPPASLLWILKNTFDCRIFWMLSNSAASVPVFHALSTDWTAYAHINGGSVARKCYLQLHFQAVSHEDDFLGVQLQLNWPWRRHCLLQSWFIISTWRQSFLHKAHFLHVPN